MKKKKRSKHIDRGRARKERGWKKIFEKKAWKSRKTGKKRKRKRSNKKKKERKIRNEERKHSSTNMGKESIQTEKSWRASE